MQLLTQDIKEFVSKTKLGFIATVCPDGTPNLSPKGTTIVWDEDHLAFADIRGHFASVCWLVAIFPARWHAK